MKKTLDTYQVVYITLSQAESTLSQIIKDKGDKFNLFFRAREEVFILETILYCEDMKEESQKLGTICNKMNVWSLEHDNIVEASKSARQLIRDVRYEIWDKLKN